MKYQKPSATKFTAKDLKQIIKAKASSRCGMAGCENPWVGNEPDCTDVYHNACLDENNWSSGSCRYGSWLDR